MSLLMEALRKAEEAKRRAAQEAQQQEGNTDTGVPPEVPVTGQPVLTERQDPIQTDTLPDLAFTFDDLPEQPPQQQQDPAPAGDTDLDDIFASLKLADMPEPAAEKSMPGFMLDPAPVPAAAPGLDILPDFLPEPDAVVDRVHEPVPEAPLPKPTAEKIVPERDVRETTTSGSGSSKKSARAVFAAKSKQPDKSRKRAVILSSALVLILLLAGGAWFLIPAFTSTGTQFTLPTELASVDQAPGSPDDSEPQLNQELVQEPGAEAEASETVEALQEALALTPAVSNDQPLISQPNFETPAVETPIVDTPTAVTPSVAASASAQPEPAPSTAVPVDTTNTAATDNAAISQPPSSPIQISRSSSMRNPDMQMLSAWSAYQQGDYAAARMLYQQSVARDPDNRDALLGLAASAMQQGDMSIARQAYSHLLTLNPRDPLARTGLLETTTTNDPMQLEIDLKSLLTTYPDVAAISYSLGNLYASQQRWHDAQQSYYNALLTARNQADGAVSPDYAFNLAISLERINQPRAAINFYREARTLSEHHAPGFDVRMLDQRLQTLEATLP